MVQTPQAPRKVFARLNTIRKFRLSHTFPFNFFLNFSFYLRIARIGLWDFAGDAGCYLLANVRVPVGHWQLYEPYARPFTYGLIPAQDVVDINDTSERSRNLKNRAYPCIKVFARDWNDPTVNVSVKLTAHRKITLYNTILPAITRINDLTYRDRLFNWEKGKGKEKKQKFIPLLCALSWSCRIYFLYLNVIVHTSCNLYLLLNRPNSVHETIG